MAVRPIILFPDPRLKLKAAPVTAFDAALADLAADLADTMRAAPGVGITAPHIGVLQRVVVLLLEEDKQPAVYVNPEIIATGGEAMAVSEGSVSMPGARETIERPSAVTVRYQTLAGEWREEQAEGFRAVCHQHEIDQLEGVFWLDRLSRLKRERLIKKWRLLVGPGK